MASDAPRTQMLQLSVEPVHERVLDAAWRAGEQIVEAYQRSPALVIGLAVAGALPLLAGFVWIGRAMRRREQREVRAPVLSDDRIPAGAKAWIEAAAHKDAAAVPIAFTGELLRIGRHSDNDIALEHVSVHRHHALIQRTPDQEFVLIDLTAGTGNVLRVNGQPVARARLRDGDRIMLGEESLVFRLGNEAPAGSFQPSSVKPIPRSPRETHDVERDAVDEPTGRATDRIETRRIGPTGRLAARRSDRGRA